MKKISFLFLLFITQFSFSQNFELISNDGVFFFENSHYKPAYEIDSIKQIENGKIYYPYHSGVVSYNEDGYALIDPNTSWIGDSIFLDHANNTTFYNNNGYSLYFKHFTNLTPWIIWEDNNGAYLEGKYLDFEEKEILPGLIDFVATMQIHVFDSLGNPIESHPIDGQEIEVSSHYGILKFFTINSFNGINNYDDKSPKYRTSVLTGVLTNEFSYGDIPRFLDLVTSLDIGLETHIVYKEWDISYEVKRVLKNKIIQAPYITYLFEDCIHKEDNHSDTIFKDEYRLSFNYTMRPNEIFDSSAINEKPGFLNLYDFGLGMPESYNKPYFVYRKYIKRSGNMDEWVLKPDVTYSMGTSAVHRFIDGLGDVFTYRGESGRADEIVYYKTLYNEWGTPLEFSCPNTGISETQITPITLFPNPAEDVIQIESPQKIDAIQIYDLQGRLVKSEELNGRTSLNVSELESGVYLIEILNENKILHRQKLIVK